MSCADRDKNIDVVKYDILNSFSGHWLQENLPATLDKYVRNENDLGCLEELFCFTATDNWSNITWAPFQKSSNHASHRTSEFGVLQWITQLKAQKSRFYQETVQILAHIRKLKIMITDQWTTIVIWQYNSKDESTRLELWYPKSNQYCHVQKSKLSLERKSMVNSPFESLVIKHHWSYPTIHCQTMITEVTNVHP